MRSNGAILTFSIHGLLAAISICAQNQTTTKIESKVHLSSCPGKIQFEAQFGDVPDIVEWNIVPTKVVQWVPRFRRHFFGWSPMRQILSALAVHEMVIQLQLESVKLPPGFLLTIRTRKSHFSRNAIVYQGEINNMALRIVSDQVALRLKKINSVQGVNLQSVVHLQLAYSCTQTKTGSPSNVYFNVHMCDAPNSISKYWDTKLPCHPKYKGSIIETHCLHRRQICDGRHDCPSGEDEQHCDWDNREEQQFFNNDLHQVQFSDVFDSEVQCPPKWYDCDSLRSVTGRHCIPPDWICDDMADCPSGEDEVPEACLLAPIYRASVCPAGTMLCSSESRCVPYMWVCDGRRDCFSGTDEEEVACVWKRQVVQAIWKKTRGRKPSETTESLTHEQTASTTSPLISSIPTETSLTSSPYHSEEVPATSTSTPSSEALENSSTVPYNSEQNITRRNSPSVWTGLTESQNPAVSIASPTQSDAEKKVTPSQTHAITIRESVKPYRSSVSNKTISEGRSGHFRETFHSWPVLELRNATDNTTIDPLAIFVHPEAQNKVIQLSGDYNPSDSLLSEPKNNRTIRQIIDASERENMTFCSALLLPGKIRHRWALKIDNQCGTPVK